MGTSSGSIYCYDPVLKDKGVVVKYNNVKEVKKQRKVDHVKWFEANVEGTNSNKFIVVFDDGTFYVFFRDLNYLENNNEKIVRIPCGTHSNVGAIYNQINDKNFVPNPRAPEYKEYTREQIIRTLQKEIEGYDFDKHYSTAHKQRNIAGPSSLDGAHEPVRAINQSFKEVQECISV